MNQNYLEFLMRFGPLIQVIAFVAFLAIPVALLMIWSQLWRLNDQLRIRSVLEAAREDTGKRAGRSTS